MIDSAGLKDYQVNILKNHGIIQKNGKFFINHTK